MQFSDYERDYLTSLGNLILRYNNAEERSRSLLVDLTTARPKTVRGIMLAKITTVELGAVGITHALQCYAKDVVESKFREPILHAADYMDRIREYRNFYVHGIGTIINTDSGPKGFLHTDSAKGSLKEHKTVISKEDIDGIAKHCDVAARYLNYLGVYLAYLTGDWEPGWPKPKLPSKPPLPDRLKKPVRHWTEYFPQRQSSEE